MIRKLIAHPTIRQFAKFFIVGGSSAICDMIVYFSLLGASPWFGDHILYANAAGFCAGFTVNYFWNRRWTFRSRDPNIRRQMSIYFVIQLSGFGISQLILAGVYHVALTLTSHLWFSRIAGKVFAGGTVMFWNFLLGRWLAFKPYREI
jgi:dolichol-phosphate mannosyltransferase